MTHARRDRGTSMLELVAVMAIFSLVAVMALNLLTAGLNAQTRVAASGGEVAEIAAALAVLRRDLEALQPISRGTAGPAAGFVLPSDAPGVSLVTGSAGSSQSVDWRLRRDGALTRSARPVSGGADGAETGTAVVMARGFSGLSFRVTDAAGGWRAAVSLRPDQATDLPRGIAVELAHDTLGTLPLVVAR